MEAILDAAARVFAAHGWAAGTTNRIAERAGVSIGSLYEYFGSKEDLLAALLTRHLEEAEALLGALDPEALDPAEPLDELIRRWTAGMVALHAREPAFHRVVFEEAPIPPGMRRQLGALERATAARLATVLAAHPEVRVSDPALAAAVVVQVVESLTHWLVIHRPATVSLATGVDETTALVSRYLRGPTVPQRSAPPRAPAPSRPASPQRTAPPRPSPTPAS